MRTKHRDVAIVGAGMSGLAAALEVTEQGGDVLLLEKAPRPGGSMYISGGHIWTYRSVEDVERVAPNGNVALQQTVVESLESDLTWLEEHGVTLKEPTSQLPRGRRIEPPEFTDHILEVIKENGGELWLESPMCDLELDKSGAITAVIVDQSNGDRCRVEADSVVLATGGFQGNERLVETYITDRTDRLWLRSNPWSTGDGLVEALAIGAKTTKGMGLFYGHNLAAPPANFSSEAFADVTQYYGPVSVALGEDGTRFTDESATMMEEQLVRDTATKAEGRAYYVIDQDLYTAEIHTGRRPKPFVEKARDAGGNVATEDNLEALGRTLTEWGVNGTQAVRTIREYNEAVALGDAHHLRPPRRNNQHAIDTPPFHVVEVQPGITFTLGGLDVTSDMEVYRRSGTVSTIEQFPANPRELVFDTIDGLYAAGVDVGNISSRGYIGGLSCALVTGRIAGRNAAANASRTIE